MTNPEKIGDWENKFMKKEIKVNPPKLRKGQLCFRCFKEIKKDWCYNGHWFHEKCKNKDTAKRIKDYLTKRSIN